MLTQDQRNQLAQQLAQLQNELEAYRFDLLRDLPKDLQKKVRAHKAIGTLTSGGLESIESLQMRIGWAVHYLSDEKFLEKYEARQQAKTKAKAAVAAIPVKRASNASASTGPINTPPPRQDPQSPQSSGLDFGPFDPRKSQL